MNIPRRLILAYKKEGFVETGGIKRLAIETAYLLAQKYPSISIYTLSECNEGILDRTKKCKQLQYNDQLIIFGCNITWGYRLALKARINNISVAWIPCFHDPKYAQHPLKARLAQIALCLSQLIGITI